MSIFSRKKDVPAELVAQATPLHEAMRAADEQPRYKRPGELPPVPYITNTLGNLSKIADKYQRELTDLDADIARLTEERRQLAVSVAAIEVAINSLSDPNETVQYNFNEVFDPDGRAK